MELFVQWVLIREAIPVSAPLADSEAWSAWFVESTTHHQAEVRLKMHDSFGLAMVGMLMDGDPSVWLFRTCSRTCSTISQASFCRLLQCAIVVPHVSFVVISPMPGYHLGMLKLCWASFYSQMIDWYPPTLPFITPVRTVFYFLTTQVVSTSCLETSSCLCLSVWPMSWHGWTSGLTISPGAKALSGVRVSALEVAWHLAPGDSAGRDNFLFICREELPATMTGSAKTQQSLLSSTVGDVFLHMAGRAFLSMTVLLEIHSTLRNFLLNLRLAISYSQKQGQKDHSEKSLCIVWTLWT